MNCIVRFAYTFNDGKEFSCSQTAEDDQLIHDYAQTQLAVPANALSVGSSTENPFASGIKHRPSPAHLLLAGNACVLAAIQGVSKRDFDSFRKNARENAEAVTPLGALLLQKYVLQEVVRPCPDSEESDDTVLDNAGLLRMLSNAKGFAKCTVIRIASENNAQCEHKVRWRVMEQYSAGSGQVSTCLEPSSSHGAEEAYVILDAMNLLPPKPLSSVGSERQRTTDMQGQIAAARIQNPHVHGALTYLGDFGMVTVAPLGACPQGLPFPGHWNQGEEQGSREEDGNVEGGGRDEVCAERASNLAMSELQIWERDKMQSQQRREHEIYASTPFAVWARPPDGEEGMLLSV